MIQKILLSIMLLLQLSYAQQTGEETMDTSNILMDKPYYTVRIGAANTNIIVTLNGETVFQDYTEGQILLEMPVNHLMTSGANRLEVKLLGYENEGFKINPNAEAHVALQIKKSGDFTHKPLTISRIYYEKGHITSTPEGMCSSARHMEKDPHGDINISKLEQKKIDGLWSTEKVKGLWLTQNVTLQTPFPRWKFLDAEKLYDGIYELNLTIQEYEKLKKRKDIQELYALVDKIHQKLQAKDSDWVASLFKERNNESDIAFYKPKGDYDRDIRKGLKELVNDPNYEIFIAKNPPFYISEGGHTIEIRSAISYNLKKGKGNSRYDIRFRREKGKWILTR